MVRFSLCLTFYFLSHYGIESVAAIITIENMNADVQSQLEGDLGGSGVDGGTSLLTIDANPSVAASATTFADYTVSNVDLDDNATFTDSFTFRIVFSSASGAGVNFGSTLETMGVDGENSGNETFDLNESFTMAYTIISDTSATHDVAFDGMSAVDFVSMSDTDLDITSVSGNTTITLLGGSTSLGGLRVDPTFTYGNTGNVVNSGTFEDWSIQFSSSSVATVPEPSTIAMSSLALCAFAARRFRQRRKAATPIE